MSLKISRVLHAGYVFEFERTQIIFDPIFENPFSRNCYAFPDVRFDQGQIKKLKFAAIFISHFHDDHCSFESLDFLDRTTPIYVFCVFEELFSMLKELGFQNIFSLQIDQPVQIGSLEIIPRRALDADVDSMFHVRAGSLNVLNVVDSWIDPQTLEKLSEFAPWDMVLWPFQTLREIEILAPTRAEPGPAELPPEWLPQLKILNSRFVIASSCQFIQESWSWHRQAFFPISYQKFKKTVEEALPKTKILRLDPSLSMTLTKTDLKRSLPLPWVLPQGPQDVDYDYRPELEPPSTAEISKNFPELTNQQKNRVTTYCQSGLLEKYRSLDSTDEPYFHKTRIWQLSVYDSKGEAQIFYYQLQKNKIETAVAGLADWKTEVPQSKLFSALEEGESLTSMYLRIYTESQDADIIEDPLIRCLFTGAFGSYQAAQLARILSAKKNAAGYQFDLP